MSEEPIEAQAERRQETPPAPTLSNPERIFVRLTLWQTVLSVAGVLIAVIALYAALSESAAVRQQTAAAVWPFVQLSIEDYDDGDEARFTMSLTNAGVGPAKMHGLRLIIDDVPMVDWAHAVTHLGGEVTDQVDRNFVSDRVLRPEETVAMIRTHDAKLARQFQAAIADPVNSIAYCYCSIFDQCWLADSTRDLQKPEPLETCPDFGDARFRD